MAKNIFVGCAGWKVPKRYRAEEKIHHLQQYSKYFNCVEINSSFYRNHKAATYAEWAALVPDNFRFALKIPRSVSHNTKLRRPELLLPFLEATAVLGHKRGPFLLQTAPKLVFDKKVVEACFKYLRQRFEGVIVCEPRHKSWIDESALAVMRKYEISLVAADPGVVNVLTTDYSKKETHYIRLHGAPQTYFSPYSTEFLSSLSDKLRAVKPISATWVIFDNTAWGHAFPNAIRFNELLSK